MPAPSSTQLIEFRDWTLRVRTASAEPARLLLLVHGWTGDEDSMWIFVRRFASRYWIVAPRAPHPTKPSGYSWRRPDSMPGAPPTFEDLRPAAEQLIGLVDSYGKETGIETSQFDVIGFSQGAALVNVLALIHPQRLGRLGILAGFMPAGAEELIVEPVLKGKPVFVAHGTQDERVNVAEARRSIQLLESAGAQVSYCEDEVGHKLSAGCLRALEAFFA